MERGPGRPGPGDAEGDLLPEAPSPRSREARAGLNLRRYAGLMAETPLAFQSKNPATGELVESFSATSPEALERIVSGANEAFGTYRRWSFAERAQRMKRAAELLRERAPEFARSMALEMGKPIAQGEAEIQKCAGTCDHYAEHAERFLSPEARPSDASKSYVRFDPLGVVFAVMPWNFPFWQVFRFAAPALMAGNAVVLKHASNVSRCALHIEEVVRAAGFPEALFRAIFVGHETAAGLLGDPRIRAVTLTGSDSAGSRIGERAGRELKKAVLELGGSDPFIVLEDADLTKAARVAADARLVNGGQSCIAAKRFIVVDAVYDAFLELFTSSMRARKMGDPMSRQTDIGPQARADLRDALHAQVEESVKRGAKPLLGGSVPPGPGAFYPPTVLTAVHKGIPAFDEETFGPVAAVVRAKDEADAIEIANDSVFGLGASIWTGDTARGQALAALIEAGCVFVNGMVKSDPRLPFGGIKRSGYGRELSDFGIREFVNVKTVWVA
jgi:succinate-semialdehyde dehydrogenase / glutarate-semialdehyde dehydrogenase